MRKLAWIPFLLVVAMAAAQHPPAKDMMVPRKIFVALSPPVKAELKLTQTQYDKIIEAFGGALQVEGERISLSITPDTDLDALSQDAMKVLDDTQRGRLNEVWLQRLGGVAAADSEVAKKLAISEAQKSNIDRLIEEAGQKLLDLFQGGHDESIAKQAEDVRKDAAKKIEALFTVDQKKTFETMKGKPFKVKEGGES